jgi:hypothetical protein
MQKLLNKSTIINAVMFQTLWFACVVGSANKLLWPSIVAGIVMLFWQLSPARRHRTDLLVLLAAILLGLIIDTGWTIFGVMEFTDPRPVQPIAPIWILIMWVGFALTINHSMMWMQKHALMPALLGFVGGPMAYYAGLKLGAVEFLLDFWTVIALLGVVWAIALTILVKISQTGNH